MLVVLRTATLFPESEFCNWVERSETQHSETQHSETQRLHFVDAILFLLEDIGLCPLCSPQSDGFRCAAPILQDYVAYGGYGWVSQRALNPTRKDGFVERKRGIYPGALGLGTSRRTAWGITSMVTGVLWRTSPSACTVNGFLVPIRISFRAGK